MVKSLPPTASGSIEASFFLFRSASALLAALVLSLRVTVMMSPTPRGLESSYMLLLLAKLNSEPVSAA
ncbi:Uncharacterised protein [Vibrio cholerae]|nr:Uncharacterised protein [Vibrio cholerae]